MKRILIDAYKTFEDLYNSFTQKGENSDAKNLIVLFTGNNDPTTGKSWCPHCVYAKPVIEKVLEDLKPKDGITFATVLVGGRDEWKRPDNPYRLHSFKINCVPTLISLNNNLRLNGSECWDKEKVSHFFSKSV